ncbi:MAG: biotin--[acetyl-CoA-carboxylase] ligase [Actinomycetota bacterium]|nr:biotin--[acetyl-CoA-carboxylase] ligase [Actinomycetota bacterium]
MAVPDIDPNYVEGRLADREVAWPRPVVVAVLGSTNADLLARAADGLPEGSVLVADEQTAGRGRMGRSWASAPGAGLWCSVLVRFGPDERGAIARLPLLAGVSVAGAVAGLGVPAVLKWPNDVIVEQRKRDARSGKLAGILAESDGAGAAVVGIGVNVSQAVDGLPVPDATSLALEGAEVGRADLLVDILTRLHGHLRDLRATGGAETMAEYRRLCITVGRDITASLPSGEVLVGRAIGIADDGRLGIHVSGKTVYVAAGDVIHATI